MLLRMLLPTIGWNFCDVLFARLTVEDVIVLSGLRTISIGPPFFFAASAGFDACFLDDEEIIRMGDLA